MKKNIAWWLLVVLFQQLPFCIIAMDGGTSSVLTINLDEDKPKEAQAALLFELYENIYEENDAFIDDPQITKEVINTPCNLITADFRAINATALHGALIFRSEETIKKLVGKGANCNVFFDFSTSEGVEFQQCSVLHFAIAQEISTEVLDFLIGKGAQPNILGVKLRMPERELEKFTSLDLAIALENDDVVALLVKYKSLVNNTFIFRDIDSHGIALATFEEITPLHLSILHEQHGLANDLIENGADVNALCTVTQKGDKGYVETESRTPLHFAVELKLKDVIPNLLKAGADASAQDSAGLTPQDYADRAGWSDDFGKLLAGEQIEEKKDGMVSKLSEKIKQEMDEQKKTLTFALSSLSLKLVTLREKLGFLKKKLRNLQELLLVKCPEL